MNYQNILQNAINEILDTDIAEDDFVDAINSRIHLLAHLNQDEMVDL